VVLRVRTRKFFCDNVHCKKKTFAEKLEGLTKKYSRRTSRLDENLLKLVMTSSAEVVYRIMKETVLCISSNTLIRLIRNYEDDTEGKYPSKYIGIDDWAIKKGKIYGTQICDLTKYSNGYFLKEEENNDVSENKDINLIEDEDNEIESLIKTKYQAERQASHMKKIQRIQEVKHLFCEGYNISQISKKMDLDWKTVKTYIKMETMPTGQRRKRRL